MTRLTFNNLSTVSGTGTINVDSNSVLYANGHIIQVIQTVKSNTFSAAPGANQFISIPEYSATITPKNVRSKILVVIDLYLGMTSYQSQIRVMRNFEGTNTTTTQSVPVWLFGGNNGAPVSSRPSVTFYNNFYGGSPTYICARTGGQFVDSPNTLTPCTYSVQIKDYTTSTIYVNRSHTWQNTTDVDGAGSSFLTLMEIAA